MLFKLNNKTYKTLAYAQEAAFENVVVKYDELLDNDYGDVEICGMTYTASNALRQVDPIEYHIKIKEYVLKEIEKIEEINEEVKMRVYLLKKSERMTEVMFIDENIFNTFAKSIICECECKYDTVVEYLLNNYECNDILDYLKSKSHEYDGKDILYVLNKCDVYENGGLLEREVN